MDGDGYVLTQGAGFPCSATNMHIFPACLEDTGQSSNFL